MATQLALQRNFVTITPSNQISSSNPQSNLSTTAIASPAANGEIVTITDGNQVSTSETSNAPIHIMQTHTQVSTFYILTCMLRYSKRSLITFADTFCRKNIFCKLVPLRMVSRSLMSYQ